MHMTGKYKLSNKSIILFPVIQVESAAVYLKAHDR